MVPSNRHIKRPKFYSNYSKHRSNRRFLPLFRLPASLRESLVENLDKILDEIFRLYPRRQCRDAVNKTTLTLIHTKRPLLSTRPAHTLRLLYINSANNRCNVIGSDTCHTCGIAHNTTRTSSIFKIQDVATRRNMMAKRTKHVAPNNVAICWDRLAGALGSYKGKLI